MLYYILNGDALKSRFPEILKGELLVMREALVDGNVGGENLEEFYKKRATFISSAYAGVSPEEYYKKSVSELEKIRNIPSGEEINLWFEDDLFCQINLWFVLHLLAEKERTGLVYLVRPLPHSPYSFGHLSDAELLEAYQNRELIFEPEKLAGLWKFYQDDDRKGLLKTSEELEAQFPFLKPAVLAHVERFPDGGSLGRPSRVLKQIMAEIGTEDFAAIFKEFSRREPIYGFGDLQVKRLYNELR